MSVELQDSMDGRRLGQMQFYLGHAEALSSEICIVCTVYTVCRRI